MTAVQELAARLRPAPQGGAPAGEGHGRDPWEDAPAPARVGRRIVEGLLDREVPAERIGLLTNVMHWAYGTGWGAVYGLLRGSGLLRGPRGGAAFGAIVWASSYAALVPMGVYEPPWAYRAEEIALEGGYHAAYGMGTALGWAVVGR